MATFQHVIRHLAGKIGFAVGMIIGVTVIGHVKSPLRIGCVLFFLFFLSFYRFLQKYIAGSVIGGEAV